jgi:3-isopropylmalate dehydrogenase
VLSVALMLDHLGLPDAAARVDAAVARDVAARGSGSADRSTARTGDVLAELASGGATSD